MIHLHRLLRSLRKLLLGPKFQRAADRNRKAADRLDEELRKVLKK